MILKGEEASAFLSFLFSGSWAWHILFQVKKLLTPSLREIFPGLLVTGIILVMVSFALLQRGWQHRQDQIHSFQEYGHSLRDKLMAQYFERVGDGQTLSNLDFVREALLKREAFSRASLDSFFKKYLDIYVVYSQVAILDRDGLVVYSLEKDASPLIASKPFPGFVEVRADLYSHLEKAKKEAFPFVSDSAIYTNSSADGLERVFFTPIFMKERLQGFVALQTNSLILDREIANIKEALAEKYFPELRIALSNLSGRKIEFLLATADSNQSGLLDRLIQKLFPMQQQQNFFLPLSDPRLGFMPEWRIDLQVKSFSLLKWSYWLQVIAIMVTVLIGGAIWYVVAIFLRQKDRDQRVFTQGILDAQERERGRLAREIHDGVGQILLATKMQLSRLHKQNEADAESVGEVKRSLDLAIKEIRAISHGLHPSILENLSLTDAVYQKMDEIEESFQEVMLDINLDKVEQELSKDFKSNLFRILQEAIQNVIKHARASMLKVVLQNEEDRIRLRIEDNGVGFSKSPNAKISLGLRSMEERAKIFGGDFRFGNNDTAGGYVECVFEVKGQVSQNANK